MTRVSRSHALRMIGAARSRVRRGVSAHGVHAALRSPAATSVEGGAPAGGTAHLAAPAEAAPTFRTGDEVMARHEADGKWYPARIASVTNAGEHAVYSVIYTKTRTTETLRGADLRVRKADPNAPAPRPAKSAAKAQAQRMMTNDERARERERKKARKEKKLAREAEGPWIASGCDPEGIDLICGERSARVRFPRRATDPASLRAILVELANAARQIE